MESQKALAYLYSKEKDGKQGPQEQVEILDNKIENGEKTYLVKTESGIICTAIFNFFTNTFYADDVFGIVENNSQKRDIEM